jgi:hypothetical protein
MPEKTEKPTGGHLQSEEIANIKMLVAPVVDYLACIKDREAGVGVAVSEMIAVFVAVDVAADVAARTYRARAGARR